MSRSDRVVLALDLGTSGSRAMAFNASGAVVARAYHEFPSRFPRPGWVEQDPEALWRTTHHALTQVLRRVGAGNVVSLGITNQRETTILWSRQTGRPVAPAIVWQDRRTATDCQRYMSREARLRRDTGLLVDPYFSATKIRWLLDHVPGLAARARCGEICFGTPDTWLLWKLTGGQVFATEPSNASRTLLFHLQKGAFDPTLARIFGIPTALLPDVKASDATFGKTSPEVTGQPIPIRGILGDQQAALFAQGPQAAGLVKNTYGTGLFLLTNTGRRLVRAPGLLTTVAWRLGDRTEYALEGSVLVGGAVLNWLRDSVGVLRDYGEAERLARSLADNEGVYFVPALQGLGSPYWNASARGLITGLTRKATRATLVRAALESLAYQSRDVVEAMQDAQRRPIRRLRADGGATVNSFLMQFQADLLGVPVECPAMAEVTALGAAGISAIASGFWTPETLARSLRRGRTYRPRMPPAERERLYAGWSHTLLMAQRA